MISTDNNTPAAAPPLNVKKICESCGAAASIAATLLFTYYGQWQEARLVAFVLYVAANCCWIKFSQLIGSRPLLLLNITYLLISSMGIYQNL